MESLATQVQSGGLMPVQPTAQHVLEQQSPLFLTYKGLYAVTQPI